MKFMQRGAARQAEEVRRLEAGEDDYDIQEKQKKKDKEKEQGGGRLRFAGPAKEGEAVEFDEEQSHARVRFVEGTHQVMRAASDAGRVTKTKGPISIGEEGADSGDGAVEQVEDDVGDDVAAADMTAAKKKKKKRGAAAEASAETAQSEESEAQAAKRKRKERKAKASSEALDKGTCAFFFCLTALLRAMLTYALCKVPILSPLVPTRG